MPVHAGELTAQWVGSGAEDRFSLPVARRAGVYPPDYVFRPVRIGEVRADASTFRIGDAEITAIAPYTTQNVTKELYGLRDALEAATAPKLLWDKDTVAPMGAVKFARKVNDVLPAGFLGLELTH